MKKMLRILGFTAVETVGLAAWLALTTVNAGVAVAVLFGTLLVEHVLNVNTTLGRGLGNLDRLPGILGFTGIETVAWVAWLGLLVVNPLLAFTTLAVLLLVEHNAAGNTIAKRPFFTRLLDGKALGHTLIEATGCGIWIALVRANQPVEGILVLFGALLLHHTIAVNDVQKELGIQM